MSSDLNSSAGSRPAPVVRNEAAWIGFMADFERDLIRERNMAGLAAARARGRKGGSPNKLTLVLRRQAEAILRDRNGCPFVSEVIRSLSIGRVSSSYFEGADPGTPQLPAEKGARCIPASDRAGF